MEERVHPLRRIREQHGLTQDEMAALLGYATTAKVSSLEHGARVSGGKVEILCDLFGIDRREFREEEQTWADVLRKRVAAVISSAGTAAE